METITLKKWLSAKRAVILSQLLLACKNSHFSLLLAAWDILWGGTSVIQRQKFHTVEVNECLHNKSGSLRVPNANFFNWTFLLVDFGKVLCLFVNELQQNSNASCREEYTPQNVDCFVRVFSHDVTAAILVSQNNETAAMLVSQTNHLGIELFSYTNAFFCFSKFA